MIRKLAKIIRQPDYSALAECPTCKLHFAADVKVTETGSSHPKEKQYCRSCKTFFNFVRVK